MTKTWPPEFITDAKNLGANRVIGFERDAQYSGDCHNCGGTGAMMALYVDGGPYNYIPPTKEPVYTHKDHWYTGSLHAAPCPACDTNLRLVWLARNCGLEGDDLDIRLDHFKAYPGKEEARQAGADLLAQVPNPHGWVTLHGDYGRGKTMLAKALINGFRVAGVAAKFAKLSDLLAEVRIELDSQRAAEMLLSQYKTVPVLAIDEVDRVNWTSWAREVTFRLLDARYSLRRSALTILVSNLAPLELPDEIAYLGSRMTEGRVVKVGGADVRGLLGERQYDRYND